MSAVHVNQHLASQSHLNRTTTIRLPNRTEMQPPLRGQPLLSTFPYPQHHDDDVEMVPGEISAPLPSFYSQENDNVIIEGTAGFGSGPGDNSDEEQIQYVPNWDQLISEGLDLLLRQNEALPGDRQNQREEIVNRDARWYPFKSKEVCDY
jgi:hypothetical protein